MEPGRRLPVLSRRLAWALLALAGLAAGGRAAHASAPSRAAEAAARAFPGARLAQASFVLDAVEQRAIERRARVKLGSRLVAAWSAWRGDTLVGAAFLDQRDVRTLPATLLVAVARDTTLARVEVLAFHEPPEYRPSQRWLARFEGRRLDERLWPQRDVRNLAGATLSTRAATEAVRSSLALYGALAPRFARPPAERP